MSRHRTHDPASAHRGALAAVAAVIAVLALAVALDGPTSRPTPAPAPTSAAPCHSVPFTYMPGGRTWWSCNPNPEEAP